MLEPGTVQNEVMVGHDGHLFLAGGKHLVLAHASGERKVSRASLANFAANIRARADFARACGAAYLHVVSPDKHSALPQLLPVQVAVNLGTLYLSQSSEISDLCFYPLDLLREAGSASFWRTDTHVSDLGNVVLASALAQILLQRDCTADCAFLKTHVRKEKPYCGDLGSKLQPPVTLPELYLDHAWWGAQFSNRLSRNEGIVDIVVTPKAKTQRRLLVFGDSFGRGLARVLSYYFRETVFLRTRFFYPDMVDAIQPDVIVSQNVERYMAQIAADAERPCFHMYPYLGAEPVSFRPDAGFGEAFSAMLSVGRPPYAAFAARMYGGEPGGQGGGAAR